MSDTDSDSDAGGVREVYVMAPHVRQPEMFYGTQDQDFAFWLETVENFFTLANVGVRNKRAYLLQYLSRSVLEWVRRSADNANYDELVALMRQRYSLSESEKSLLRTRLGEEKQGKVESPRSYIERVLSRSSQCDISDIDLMHIILNGMNRELAQLLLVSNPTSVDDLLRHPLVVNGHFSQPSRQEPTFNAEVETLTKEVRSLQMAQQRFAEEARGFQQQLQADVMQAAAANTYQPAAEQYGGYDQFGRGRPAQRGNNGRGRARGSFPRGRGGNRPPSNNRPQQNTGESCRKCGYNTCSQNPCIAKGKQCSVCQGFDHFSSRCPSR